MLPRIFLLLFATLYLFGTSTAQAGRMAPTFRRTITAAAHPPTLHRQLPLTDTQLSSFFHGGASHITSSKTMKRYRHSPTIGGPNGLYVAPQSHIDELIYRAQSLEDRAKAREYIEYMLGLEPGSLKDGTLVKFDFADPHQRGLARPTSGNRFHRPRIGLTTGDIPEATIPPQHKSDVLSDPNVRAQHIEGI